MLNRSFLTTFMLTLFALSIFGCPGTGSQVRDDKDQGKSSAMLQKEQEKIQKMVLQGKQYDAIQKYKKLMDEKGEEKLEYLYLYGYALRDKNKKWKVFDRCLRRNPTYYWCLIGRGKVYVLWGIKDKALDDFKNADKAIPGRAEPLLGRASLAHAKKQTNEAIQLYKQVLAKSPTNAEAQYGLAQLHEAKGNRQESIKWYLELLKQKPDHFDALRSVGHLYQQEKQDSSAATYLAKALKMRPKDFRLAIRLAGIHEKLGQPDKALSLYEKASKLPQAHFKTYFRLGVLREAAGNIDGAVQSFDNAHKMDRDHEETLFRLGRLYQRKGDHDKAISILRKAIRKNNKRILAREVLVKSLMEKKEYADALRQYQRILELKPDNSKVRTAMRSLLSKLGLSDSKIRGKSVGKVLSNAKKVIYRCYRKRLKEKPKLKGKLSIRLMIPRNQPVRISWDPTKSTIEDPLIRTCVKWTLRRAVFPRRGIRISYQFSFRP